MSVLGVALLSVVGCGGETKEVIKEVEVVKIVEVIKEVIVEVEKVDRKQKTGIVLSIDDGVSLPFLLENEYLFDKYGAKGTYFVSGFNHGMSQDLIDLQDRGWEIGLHTQNHYNAVEYVAEHSAALWLQDEVKKPLKNMSLYGLEVDSFAYPFGIHSLETDMQLKPYFKTVRGFGGSINMDYSEGFYEDGYFYFGVSVDSLWLYEEALFAAMETAKEKGLTLVLGMHVISEDHDTDYKISPEDLEKILSHASSIGLDFLQMRDLGY